MRGVRDRPGLSGGHSSTESTDLVWRTSTELSSASGLDLPEELSSSISSLPFTLPILLFSPLLPMDSSVVQFGVRPVRPPPITGVEGRGKWRGGRRYRKRLQKDRNGYEQINVWYKNKPFNRGKIKNIYILIDIKYLNIQTFD